MVLTGFKQQDHENPTSSPSETAAPPSMAGEKDGLITGKEATTANKPHFMSSVYLRSTADFCGFGETKAWSLTCEPSALTKKVHHNFSIFYLNYFRLTVILFFLISFLQFALIPMFVLTALWVGSIYISKYDEQKLKNGGK